MTGLTVSPGDDCTYDLVALGEILVASVAQIGNKMTKIVRARLARRAAST